MPKPDSTALRTTSVLFVWNRPVTLTCATADASLALKSHVPAVVKKLCVVPIRVLEPKNHLFQQRALAWPLKVSDPPFALFISQRAAASNVAPKRYAIKASSAASLA